MHQEHHPPHVFLDDTWYIVSAATKSRQQLLAPNSHKAFVRDKLKSLLQEFSLTLAAWVILNDHYHVLMRSHRGLDISAFIRRLHGSTAHEINTRDGIRGRQVWHNFWDTCIRSEKEYWTRFNYIHHNPVKHGYVANMSDWPYSSYCWYLERKGEDWLADVFARYPIRDYTDSNEVQQT
jgi:putative transposase